VEKVHSQRVVVSNHVGERVVPPFADVCPLAAVVIHRVIMFWASTLYGN